MINILITIIGDNFLKTKKQFRKEMLKESLVNHLFDKIKLKLKKKNQILDGDKTKLKYMDNTRVFELKSNILIDNLNTQIQADLHMNNSFDNVIQPNVKPNTT